MASESSREPGPLTGRWWRETTDECAGRYPAEVSFAPGTTYLGTRGADQGMVVWDAGIYRLEEDDRALVVSTSSDELVSYPVRIEGDRMSFVDSEGCEVTYRRAGTPS
jgi:hypothetical protein